MKLIDIVYYDESSPSCLRWKIDRFSGRCYKTKEASANDPIGSITNNGYWGATIDKKTYLCHRIIWEIFFGKTDKQLDHINGIRTDNRITNLRLSSYEVNSRNHKQRKDNVTGVTGVYFVGNRCFSSYSDPIAKKQKQKSFNINKLGIMVAFRDAVIYRNRMISILNIDGYGYTDRHGTIEPRKEKKS